MYVCVCIQVFIILYINAHYNNISVIKNYYNYNNINKYIYKLVYND